MRVFCTLFDSFYLSRGVAMYESLRSHSGDFILYIFAFDDRCFDILNNLNLEKVVVVSLHQFETEELKKVKEERSRAEYCWTCTPSVIKYVIDNFSTAECTYLDADLFFYSDPEALLVELDQNGKNVLITEHRYSFLPRLYEEKRGGRFCVQFMAFRNEPDSLAVLDRWRKQCIEWCFARYEDGKFGDQKYLDEWPVLYDNVHILEHQGGGVAPWNLNRYSFSVKNEGLSGKVNSNGSRFRVVFYHFQYVKFRANGVVDIGWYLIPSPVKRLFYKPYIARILEIENRIGLTRDQNGVSVMKEQYYGIRGLIKRVLKQHFGYNLLKAN
jgi:hypothetical protein